MSRLGSIVAGLICIVTFAIGAAGAQPSGSPPSCAYDRVALMALDYERFDQDLNGGWRSISYRLECELVAADLIAVYRATNASILAAYNLKLLYWHEGQLRASAGQIAEPIALFERSYDADPRQSAWNDYVRATVAFMKQDRAALMAARESLARTPRPEGFERVQKDFREKFGSEFRWPANLDVVDGLIACFGKPYREAYSAEACRPRLGRPVWLSNSTPKKQ